MGGFLESATPDQWVRGLTVLIFSLFIFLSALSFVRSKRRHARLNLERLCSFLHINAGRSYTEQRIGLTRMSFWDYLIPVTFATSVTALGSACLLFSSELAITSQPNIVLGGSRVLDMPLGVYTGVDASGSITRTPLSRGSAPHTLQSQAYTAGIWAWLGAFLWSMNSIVRRVSTGDLTPNAYYSSGIRMILGPFLAILTFHLAFGQFVSLEGSDSNFSAYVSLLPALGFVMGTFPQRWLDYVVSLVEDRVSSRRLQLGLTSEGDAEGPRKDAQAFRRAHRLPLEMLQGMNSYHEMRFVELGIDNAQNLAMADVLELLVMTPFEPITLIDWMAQARLYVHFRDDVELLRGLGVRTAFDLEAVVTDKATPWPDHPNIRERAERVVVLLQHDPSFKYLKVYASSFRTLSPGRSEAAEVPEAEGKARQSKGTQKEAA